MRWPLRVLGIVLVGSILWGWWIALLPLLGIPVTGVSFWILWAAGVIAFIFVAHRWFGFRI